VTSVTLVRHLLPGGRPHYSLSHLRRCGPTQGRGGAQASAHLPPHAERIDEANAVVPSPSPGRVTSGPLRPPTFVARSKPFQLALERLRRLAKTSLPVLLEGETGTGKSYFAELLHAESARASNAFQPVDLAALDEGLAASELFGHAKGAFTGASARRPGLLASANGGTVFLDEIGKAVHSVQAKLLHVIERRPVRAVGEDRAQSLDLRFVAATSIALHELVRRGKVIRDLHFRLQGYRVVLPPLRDRRADIPELVTHCARSGAAECGYTNGPPVFDPRVMRALVAAPWPGNLRQLDQAVMSLMTEADGAPRVTRKHLRYDLEYLAELASLNEDQERAEIEVALVQANDRRGEAARLLHMSRAKFYRRLEKLNMGGNQNGHADADELDNCEA
jgi:DNA-binding NtrC family response regulator